MSDKRFNNENLKKAIDKSGMTREQIAVKVGCDTSSITKYYNGDRYPKTDIIIKLAELFNISTDYLLGITKIETALKTDDNTALRISCDYTGLNEDAINQIRTMMSNFDIELTDIKQNDEYMKALIDTGLLKSYTPDVFSKVINDFISSDCFNQIIERLFDEVSRLNDYYNSITDIVYDENFECLKPLAEIDIEMFLSHWYQIRNFAKENLKREHKFNLFEMQESIINYAKMIVEDIDDFDDDYSRTICNALYEVKKITDFYEEHLEEHQINDKKTADSIIEKMNKELKRIIKELEKQRNWI